MNMKKILLAISSVFLLVSCSTYTVRVDVAGVQIDGEDVKEGSCHEYSDSFFGLAGDFPLTIKVGDGDEEEYEANNYEVSADEVKETDEACEVDADEGEEGSEDDTEEETEKPEKKLEVTEATETTEATGATGTTGTTGATESSEEQQDSEEVSGNDSTTTLN